MISGRTYAVIMAGALFSGGWLNAALAQQPADPSSGGCIRFTRSRAAVVRHWTGMWLSERTAHFPEWLARTTCRRCSAFRERLPKGSFIWTARRSAVQEGLAPSMVRFDHQTAGLLRTSAM